MRDISKMAFYTSYYETAKKIPSDNERLEFYDSIFMYVFEEIKPSIKSPIVDLAITAIRPFIEADLKRKHAGAPIGNTNAAKQLENNVKNNSKQLIDLKKTNNVNVNVNDNDNEKVNVNVNDIYDTLPLPSKTKNRLLTSLAQGEFSEDYLIYCYNLVIEKYPDKTTKDLAGLFTAAVYDWEDVRKNIPTFSETKKTKEKKLKIKPLKNCTFCGSSLVTGGIPNSLMCPSCEIKTFWEIEGNAWKCNRTS